MLLVVALSLVSAALFATAAAFQQHATRVVSANQAGAAAGGRFSAALPVVSVVRDLVRSRLWLLGWTTNLLGFLIQGAALHLGSVALVQPLLVTQLLFAIPLASIWSPRRPAVRDLIAGVSICGGVAVFLSVRGAVPDTGGADRTRVLIGTACALALIAILVALAIGRGPVLHASYVAIAAGLCFALSAVFTKLTATDLVHRGIPATAADWPGYALAGSTLLGLLLEQEAFGAGPLATAVAAMSITNPLASYFLGVLAFQAALPTGAGALAAVAGSATLLFVGAFGLAHSPAIRRDAEEFSRSQPGPGHRVRP